MCLGSELLHVTKLECSFVGAFVTRAALADNQQNCLHGLNIMQSKYSYTFLGRCNARTSVVTFACMGKLLWSYRFVMSQYYL